MHGLLVDCRRAGCPITGQHGSGRIGACEGCFRGENWAPSPYTTCTPAAPAFCPATGTRRARRRRGAGVHHWSLALSLRNQREVARSAANNLRTRASGQGTFAAPPYRQPPLLTTRMGSSLSASDEREACRRRAGSREDAGSIPPRSRAPASRWQEWESLGRVNALGRICLHLRCLAHRAAGPAQRAARCRRETVFA